MKHARWKWPVFALIALAALGACFLLIKRESDPFRAQVRLLRSGDVEERRAAAGELSRASEAELPLAIPAFVAALGDDDVEVRAKAAQGLGYAVHFHMDRLQRDLPAERAEATAALISALHEREPAVARAAAEALGMLGPRAKSALPALMAILKGKGDAQTRAAAALALGTIGERSSEVIAALLDAIRDVSPGVRAAAASALDLYGPPPRVLPIDEPPVRDALVEALRDDDDRVFAAAALSLRPYKIDDVRAQVSAAARDSVRPSHTALRRAHAMGLLTRTAGDDNERTQVAASFIPLLSDPELTVRNSAISLLWTLGANAEPALPALRSAAHNDADPVVRQQAASVGDQLEKSVAQRKLGAAPAPPVDRGPARP